MRSKVGKITFTTVTALAIWKHEMLGQLSDGAWENASPEHHWEFWHRLDCEVGAENKVTMYEGNHVPWGQKTGYNIACLYEYVLDRLLSTGRMARALQHVDFEDYGAQRLAEVQERALDTAFIAFKLAQGEMGPDGKPTYGASKLAPISDSDAEEFFITDYEMRDLRADVKRIKQAMKSIKQ